MTRMKKEPVLKQCKFCSLSFSTTKSNKVYCCNECKIQNQLSEQSKQASVNRQKRLDKRLSNFADSKFARFLVAEARRAGTVQILEGLNADDLVALHKLDKDRTKYNAGSRVYALSHIYPVKGCDDLIGTLHPSNLVIAEKGFNEKRRNKTPYNDRVGKYILKTALNPDFTVEGSEDQNSILEKIKRYLGDEIMKDFVSKVKLNLTSEIIIKRKLDKMGVDYPEEAELPELRELQEKVTLKKAAKPFRGSPASIEVVLLAEFNRLFPEDHEFTQFLEDLTSPFSNVRFSHEDLNYLHWYAQSKLHGDE